MVHFEDDSDLKWYSEFEEEPAYTYPVQKGKGGCPPKNKKPYQCPGVQISEEPPMTSITPTLQTAIQRILEKEPAIEKETSEPEGQPMIENPKELKLKQKY